MKNPFSRFFRARGQARRDRFGQLRTHVLFWLQRGGQIGHGEHRHSDEHGLRLRAGDCAKPSPACRCMCIRIRAKAASRRWIIPLYPILHDEPNSEMTIFSWRETMLAHLLLWGNAYCQIIRSGRSQILGLYPLLPDRMEVDRDNAGTLTYTYSAEQRTDGEAAPRRRTAHSRAGL